MLRIESHAEYAIDRATHQRLATLLESAFPGDHDGKRSYFKQRPHHRLIGYEGDTIVAQVSLDYRVMKLNDEPVQVLGALDLCVHPDHQGKGYGKALMQAVDAMAQEYPEGVDMLFLVTFTPGFYVKLGYQALRFHVTWLKIDQHESLGMGQEAVNDCSLMVKAMKGQELRGGKLDMLGYWY